MVAHAFSLSTQRQRQVDLCEFKTSLVYGVSSRTARATQRNFLKVIIIAIMMMMILTFRQLWISLVLVRN